MTDKIHTTFGTLAKFYECYVDDDDDNDTPVTVAKDAEAGEWRATAHGGEWAPSSDEQAAELAAFVGAGN